MATTNLIVDFLVIGISCLIWIIPLLKLFRLTEWISTLFDLNVGIALSLIGFLYVLGIAINRIADDLTKKWNDKILTQVFGKNPVVNYHKQLNAVVSRSVGASEYLYYRRSLVRISRASSLNVLLGLILLSINVIIHPYCFDGKNPIFLIIGGLVILFLMLLRTWPITLRGYFYAIKNFYSYSQQNKKGKAND